MARFLNYFIPLVLYGLSACANNPLSSYTADMATPLQALSNDNLSRAESTLSSPNNLLYYLEHGTILRLSTKYNASNSDLSSAQKYIDAWVASFHNGSLGLASDTMEATLVNDKIIDYVAKDYEKVMLPTYKALNYVALDDLDSARIEITRMYNIEDVIHDYREAQYAQTASIEKNDRASTKTSFLSLAQVESMNKTKYDFAELNSPETLALKNSYQNAFSHYLAGFIFEMLREPSLARPGYVKALELNPNNQLIKQSINDIDQGLVRDNNTVDLLVIEEVGHAPELKSVEFSIPFYITQGQNKCSSLITISFPKLIVDNTSYSPTENLSIDGNELALVPFTNFNLMASRYLHDNLPNIYLRNTLRAAKDVALQQSACSGGGSLVGLIATVGSKFLGSADERTWLTLPQQIYITRLRVSRGIHTISVNNRGVVQKIKVNLTKNYAVLAYRVIGKSVYFSPQVNSLK